MGRLANKEQQRNYRRLGRYIFVIATLVGSLAHAQQTLPLPPPNQPGTRPSFQAPAELPANQYSQAGQYPPTTPATQQYPGYPAANQPQPYTAYVAQTDQNGDLPKPASQVNAGAIDSQPEIVPNEQGARSQDGEAGLANKSLLDK
ncbi:MAG: hypothetical protein AAF497_23180, partial [Planctomycetota bacterium]